MLSSKEQQIQKKVLEVYQKENPSTYNIEKDEAALKKIQDYGDRLYTYSLKILPQFFKGATLLEFGTGTGERSTNFLRWGAECTFVEMNDKAVDRAAFLFEKFYPENKYRLVNRSLFDFESDQKYDITVSNAVIHHTPDVEKAFARQVSYLKPGGVNVLGIGNTGACIQRNLQRFIVYSFAGNDEKEIEKVAEDLFQEHLNRAEKFGGRKRKAIIYDTYVNPKMDFVSVAEILEWYKKYGLQFYTSWPPVIPNVLADDLAGATDFRNYPELLSYPEWIWGTQIKEDKKLLKLLNKNVSKRSSSFRELAESLNDVTHETLDTKNVLHNVESALDSFTNTTKIDIVEARHLKEWLSEISEIMRGISQNDYERVASIVKNSHLLFRGKGGIGLNYFAAIKL